MSQNALEAADVGDTYFCSLPECELHVIIEGDGEWAELDNGCIVGRTRVDGRRVCDRCARKLVNSSKPG
jgi:hypothetical protein